MLPAMAPIGHRRAAPLLALTLLTAPRTVAAAPVRHVVLAWSQADPTCLGEADLASAVERTLGRPVFHSDAPPFAKVTGSVGRAASGGYEARIALRDKDDRPLGERTLETSGACGRLDESIAVVVTLMIDGVEETPTPLSIPPEPPRPRAPEPAAGLPEPRPASLLLTLGAGAGFSSSLLPGVAASFGVRGEMAWSRFVPIALSLRVHPAVSATTASGTGGRFSAWTGELAVCPAWARPRLRIGGCVGVEGGALSGVHVNLAAGDDHVRPLVLATLMPFLAVRLAGPVWARAGAGAWIPLLRERWGYLDARGTFEEVFRPAPVIPAATLTLEVQAGS